MKINDYYNISILTKIFKYSSIIFIILVIYHQLMVMIRGEPNLYSPQYIIIIYTLVASLIYLLLIIFIVEEFKGEF